MTVIAAPAPDEGGRVGEIEPGCWFDMALATAEGWRIDALRYTGDRRQMRLDKAARMEAIAAAMVEAA